MHSTMQYFAPIVTDSIPTSNIPTVVLGMGELAVVLGLLVSEKLYELSLCDLRKIQCYKQTPGHLAIFRTMIKACMMQEHDQLEDMEFCSLPNQHVDNTG